jgi:transcriptional regulator GlxA family with amidase domain
MEKRQIAFLLFPDMTPLDLIGPIQVLKSLERYGPFEVVTVGEGGAAVDTDVGIKMQPERGLEDVPRPYAFIVPGGALGPIKAITNDALMAYVRSVGESAEVVGSVCTGSIILAAAGLLDGRRATTHWCFLDHLRKLGAEPVRERWVEDGKFITAAGVSAGIDMAIALAARLTNEQTARMIQAVIEYDPKPPLGGIDWGWVEEIRLGQGLMSSLGPEIARILASKPELLAKLSS